MSGKSQGILRWMISDNWYRSLGILKDLLVNSTSIGLSVQLQDLLVHPCLAH